MNDQAKGSTLGWFGRVLRAVMIGAAIYYLWAFATTYMMRRIITDSGLQATEHQAIDPKPWTGERPPNEADLAIKKGYDWATERDVRNHAVCREQWTDANHDSLVSSGCSKYVTEQNVTKVVKPIPKHNGWDDGTTTAECIAEVRAYWDPVIRDMREKGDHHAASSWMNRNVGPSIQECSNFDKVRIIQVIYEPQRRLDAILDKARSGEFLTHHDIQTVKKDYPGALLYPDNQYRTKYLNAAEALFNVIGGRDKVITADEEASLLALRGRSSPSAPIPAQEP